MSLFREEVVRRTAASVEGPVILNLPVKTRVLGWLAMAVVAAAALFLSTAQYARKETATGMIVPDLGSIRLTTAKPGIIRDIYAREGAEVKAGEAIALVDFSSAVSTGDTYNLLADNVAERAEAVRSLGEASRSTIEAEKGRLRTTRASLLRELDEANQLKQLQEQRLALAESQVQRAETIAARGFLPQRELDLRRATVLTEQQGLSQTARTLIVLERQITDLDAQLEAIPMELQSLASRGRTEAAELDREQTQTEAAMSQRIVSPRDGRIAALIARPGQAVATGTAIAVITPRGSRLQAELYVPTRAAGFIRPGQRVRLLYEAFPAERYGAGEGVIESVSRTALTPGDLQASNLAVDEPVFRATVRLISESVSAYGEPVPLQPGMLLTAEISMGSRSLMQWLLDPLFAVGRRL